MPPSPPDGATIEARLRGACRGHPARPEPARGVAAPFALRARGDRPCGCSSATRRPPPLGQSLDSPPPRGRARSLPAMRGGTPLAFEGVYVLTRSGWTYAEGRVAARFRGTARSHSRGAGRRHRSGEPAHRRRPLRVFARGDARSARDAPGWPGGPTAAPRAPGRTPKALVGPPGQEAPRRRQEARQRAQEAPGRAMGARRLPRGARGAQEALGATSPAMRGPGAGVAPNALTGWHVPLRETGGNPPVSPVPTNNEGVRCTLSSWHRCNDCGPRRMPGLRLPPPTCPPAGTGDLAERSAARGQAGWRAPKARRLAPDAQPVDMWTAAPCPGANLRCGRLPSAEEAAARPRPLPAGGPLDCRSRPHAG